MTCCETAERIHSHVLSNSLDDALALAAELPDLLSRECNHSCVFQVLATLKSASTVAASLSAHWRQQLGDLSRASKFETATEYATQTWEIDA